MQTGTEGTVPDSPKLAYLLEFIQAQTGADAIEALDFQQLSGGAVQENHGLHVRMAGGSMPGEHHWVVRCNAPAALSTSLGRSQEFEVLQTAHRAGVRAPRPLWLCAGPNPLGGEFYIMERAAGDAGARGLVKDQALTAAQRQSLMFELGRNLALLHRIEWSTETLPFLARPEPNAAQRRLDECRRTLRRLGECHPAIELGLWHLGRHIPEDQACVLSHGDFRSGNYLVSQGELTAILDWEFASWSDPYEDLGWMCAACWRFGRPEREAGGVGDKADLFAGYESVSVRRIDPQRVVYWELMACVRWAAVALEQSHRHRSGQQESLELALTGRILPEIQQDLMGHLRLFLASIGTTIPETAPESIPTPAARPAGPPADQPDGAALLRTARQVLLREILPLLPSNRTYDTRMIAHAMDIAARELDIGSPTLEAQQQAIDAFYRALGLTPPDSGLPGLVRDIRQGIFSDAQQSALCALVDTLLGLKLRLSNPKRLGRATTP
ncbi:phosphotransferase [Castellaniella sp. GW247-6E4]|uniref:phosphotransferase n=1 Tax=Castellaniella sp. GW247-6E4 TaxID=3140380 RepID=UPI0033145DB3